MRRPFVLLAIALLAGLALGHELAHWRSAGALGAVDGDAMLVGVAGARRPGGEVTRGRLVAEIDRILAQPVGPLASLRLADALHELALHDPAAAARLAVSRRLDDEHLATTFRRWALVDPPAALDAWSEVQGAAALRSIGSALVRAFGGDAAAVERVGRHRPARLPVAVFLTDALAAIAETDPDGVMASALALGPSDPRLERHVLARLAAVWGARAPEEALARTDRLQTENDRADWQQRVMMSWSATDPDAAVAWIEREAGSGRARRFVGLRDEIAARQDPLAELLRLAGRSDRGALNVRMRAIEALPVRDPAAAFAAIHRLDVGPHAGTLEGVVANTVARRSPEAALDLIALHPEHRDALLSAAAGEVDDLDRAIGLVERIEAPVWRMNAPHRLVRTARRTGAFEALADWVVDAEIPPDPSFAMHTVARDWALADPRAVLAWLGARATEVPAVFAEALIPAFRAADARVRDTTLRGLRPDVRATVVGRLAQDIADRDPMAALALAERHTEGLARGHVMSRVLVPWAKNDPEGAAAAVGRIDHEALAASTTAAIARTWAQSDPEAAVRWATALGKDSSRAAAIAGVIDARLTEDAEGARRLALTQPEGPVRDAALSVLVRSGLFRNASFDADVLGAFASTAMRRQALLSVLPRILKADPPRGRALLDEHVTEPVLRETILAQAGSALY